MLAGKLVVNRLERLQLVVNDGRVLVVKNDLLELGATNLVSDTLANDLGGENKVLKDTVVDSSKSSRNGTLLGLTVTATRLGKNAALGKEHNVTVGELLLELTGQSLLDLVDRLESGRREENDNSLLSTRHINLETRDRLVNKASKEQQKERRNIYEHHKHHEHLKYEKYIPHGQT